MIDYRRALTFWSVMFFRISEEQNCSWNKEDFENWLKALPSNIHFKDDEERKLFMLIIKESFTQMINVCAKGDLGRSDEKTEILRFKRFFDIDWFED
jgi:hypothetical protein